MTARQLLALRRENLKDTLELIASNPGIPQFEAQHAELVQEIQALESKIAPPPLFVGIDPAMVRSGFAYGFKGRTPSFGVLDGIENLASLDAIREAQGLDPKAKILALIEYPTWQGSKSAATVRAAANAWERALKAAFPRRCQIRRIAPTSWMSAYRLLGRPLPEKMSDRYIPVAQALALTLDPIDENAAAAICLQQMAQTDTRMGWKL